MDFLKYNIILIKPVFNKNKNNYYNNGLLITTTKMDCMSINPIRNSFKWMFVCYKRYVSIELLSLKELMLIRQVHQSVIFVTTGFF